MKASYTQPAITWRKAVSLSIANDFRPTNQSRRSKDRKSETTKGHAKDVIVPYALTLMIANRLRRQQKRVIRRRYQAEVISLRQRQKKQKTGVLSGQAENARLSNTPLILLVSRPVNNCMVSVY
jgi:hypothetical protein